MAAEPPAQPRPGGDLALRTASAIVLLTVAIAAIWFGGAPFWLLLTVGAIGVQYEWAGLAGRLGRQRLSMLALMVPLSIMSPFAAGPSFLALGLILGAALFTASVDRGLRLAGGIFYAGLPVLALLYLREQDNGLLLTFWTMALVWATDIGAYFAGRTIGGPKLAPTVSPSKTWAGLIGGMAMALVLGLALAGSFGLSFGLAMASAPLAALAQMGDLFESAMKRRAGVKDSGTLIPGHGGLLDRIDGLVPVAPAAALVVAAEAAWRLN